MSILSFVLTFFACAATAAGGAWGMRFHINRSLEIAENEDPRDTLIRDLQAKLKLVCDDSKKSAETTQVQQEHIDLAHERIDEMSQARQKLMQEYDSCKDALKQTTDQKTDLIARCSATDQQLENLKERLQEAEMELSTQESTGDLLDPVLQTNEPEPGPGAENDTLPELLTPAVDGHNPSLIQSLTDELDRWKRHCHVLGTELKQRREKLLGQPRQINDGPPADALTAIRGIGGVMEGKLHELGIYRYRDLINLTTDDLRRAAGKIPDLRGRMSRDAWQDQARDLHAIKYNDRL